MAAVHSATYNHRKHVMDPGSSRDLASNHSDDRPSSASSNSGGPVLLTTAHSQSKTLLPQAGDVLSIEVQARNPRRRFPLNDEFLPKVKITREQIEQLKRQCVAEMNRVLRKSNAVWSHSEQIFDGGCGEWRSHYTSKQHHLTLYRRKHESDTASLRHFLARGQISSVSLKDLEYGLYCDTTTDERAVKTDLLRELFLDAAVLRVFERQRPDDAFRFFGLKWLAYISPADKFISSRDYAVVEYARTVEMKTGEKMLVKVVLPVGTDTVAGLAEREYDLVRGTMACTYMYRYDPTARAVQVFAEGSLDPSGSATSWMAKSFLTQFAPTIVNLDNCADVKHFMKHGRVLSAYDFQAKLHEAKLQEAHCTACLKSFGSGLLKRTHASCRCCGQSMCSRCVIHFTLCLPWHEKRNAEHPSAVIDERFCLKCVCLVRAHRNDGSAGDDQSDNVSVTESGSFKPVVLTTQRVMQLNFEDAPLPARELVDEAHQSHKPSGVERLRQLKERHLTKDKQRNMAERTPLPPQTAEALNRMEQSIAEQEELLRNIQVERMRREQHQREAYHQYQQQFKLHAKQQYHHQLGASQVSISSSSSQWGGKPSAGSSSMRTTDTSLSSSAYTTGSADYSGVYDTDDDVYAIDEGNGGFDLPSPPRYMRSTTAQREGTAAFV